MMMMMMMMIIIIIIIIIIMQRDSVGIANSYCLSCPGYKSRQDIRFSSSPKPTRQSLGPNQPPAQWVLEILPRGRAAGLEVEDSPPSSVDVKNKWSYTSTPLYAFMAWEGTLFFYNNNNNVIIFIIIYY
jgi:hypothetical protein